MSVMGSIFTKVFDHETTADCAIPAALGPLTFPRPVDVEAILSRIAGNRSEPLNWRQSIVDLLKLLNLDSSLTARRQLAYELGYAGGLEDGTAMNMWLQREVMRKLAEGSTTVLKAMGD